MSRLTHRIIEDGLRDAIPLLLDELPMNAGGKVDKAALAELS